MSTTGATVDELGRRRLAKAARTTDLAAFTTKVRADYDAWLSHVGGSGACSHPIRMFGTLTHVGTPHRSGRRCTRRR